MENQPSDQQMLPIDHLLKAAEVSSILRVSRSCTYSLMQTGQIPTVHIGGARRVRFQDLVNFIEKNIISAEPRSE